LATIFCFWPDHYRSLFRCNVGTAGYFEIFSFCFTALFASVILLRLFCLLPVRGRSQDDARVPLSERELPIYTILVPMFHEANMVDQLTRALIEIDHPPSLLDIKLVLEEDDEETIAAVRARALPGTFEVILVPACEPHTKPKALNFALPFARGELLVIYDAEDIPDRDQLRRAANAFHQGSERLACLQAALAYYNTDQNWLTGQFAIEYACLFDVIVPRLAAAGLP
jgi:cellulose synthase/poly-beta-1,6-N-acetylglucosamine synthase-like glycosyltransferase